MTGLVLVQLLSFALALRLSAQGARFEAIRDNANEQYHMVEHVLFHIQRFELLYQLDALHAASRSELSQRSRDEVEEDLRAFEQLAIQERRSTGEDDDWSELESLGEVRTRLAVFELAMSEGATSDKAEQAKVALLEHVEQMQAQEREEVARASARAASSARSLRWVSLIGPLSALAMLIMVFSRVLPRLERGRRRLLWTVARARAGDLGVRARLAGEDELAQIGAGLDQMLADLQQALVDRSELREALEELRQTRDQLGQAQKLEIVGRMAAGIAHDFNNILTVSRLAVQSLRAQSGYSDAVADDVRDLGDATDRGVRLAQQLLLLARPTGSGASDVVDIRETLGEVVSLLRRILPANIQLETDFAAESLWVRATPAHVEQVVVNLVVNARDALPSGGCITVSTRVRQVAGSRQAVELRVRDTGVGMSEETKARIFEPFFTTKPQGQGTGLGLATCYHVVGDMGGELHVDSSLGKGSTFTVVLPIVAAPDAGVGRSVSLPPRGGETILWVEDEASVRRRVAQLLRELGYNLIVAGDTDEAVERIRAQETPPDLLLVDLALPGRGGAHVVDVARARGWSNLHVLLVSGHPSLPRVAAELKVAYIVKPFDSNELARAVRAVLDDEPAW